MNWHLITRSAPALALTALLAVASPSFARGGGHGGGGHGGGFHGGGFHGGGFRGGYGGFNRGFYGRGYGYRGYGYGGYGYGGYYPFYGLGWGWGYPYYGYGYGSGYGYYPNYYSNYNYYTYPYNPYYYGYTNAYTAAPAQNYQSYYYAPQAANTVRVNVSVPMANAKVWIDGYATKETGTRRVFESPALTPGSQYSYTIRAQWTQDGQPVERSQTVHFRAGEQVNVDLTKPTA